MIVSPSRRLALFFALALPFLALAQTATVRGFVYDAASGEPSIFTPVSLRGATDHGAQTDVNGYFSISKVPPGHYTLRVVYLGYDTLHMELDLKADQIATEKLNLTRSSVEMKTVVISAEKKEAESTVRVGVTKLTPKQIERLPAIGGQADLAQYMQVVPGVVFTGDQGGQLYIRGGSPVQNKVLMDGMVLYNPFHSIGLFSVFDNDIIRNADILTGGFNAEYGGRISSVMDITTRDGNKNRFGGKVAASTFAAKALLEGPLKQNPDARRRRQLLPAQLPSTATWTRPSNTLYSYVIPPACPFSFTDLYGKVSLNGGQRQQGQPLRLQLHRWRALPRQVSDLDWKQLGRGRQLRAGAFRQCRAHRRRLRPEQLRSSRMKERDLDPRTSGINNFNGGLNFKYFIGDNEARYGIEVARREDQLQLLQFLGLQIGAGQEHQRAGRLLQLQDPTPGNWCWTPVSACTTTPPSPYSAPSRAWASSGTSRQRFRLKGAGACTARTWSPPTATATW
jgi:hypothetical protein